MLRLIYGNKIDYNFYLDVPRLVEDYKMYLKRRGKYLYYLHHSIIMFTRISRYLIVRNQHFVYVNTNQLYL